MAELTTSDALSLSSLLYTLPNSVLDSAETFLTTIHSTATAEAAMIEAKIISLDIILAPLLAKRVAIENIFNTYQSQAQIFSSSLSQGNSALGETNQIIQSTMSNKMSSIRRIMNEIDRTQSIRLQYSATKAIITSNINFIGRILSLVRAAKAARSAAIQIINIRPVL